MLKKRIVVVAPTYNEGDNISEFIDRLLAQQSKLPAFELYLLIADSHSSDSTPEIVRSKVKGNSKVTYLDVKKRGLGYALFKGLDYAVDKLKANYLVTLEADLSNDVSELPKFINALKDAEIVVGSRYINGGQIVNWTWWRKMVSRQANLMLRLLSGRFNLYEFTNLYRAFNREVWLKLRANLEQYEDWVFVTAFVLEALDAGFRYSEIPIVYFDRAGGSSKMRTVSHTRRLTGYVLSYRLKRYGTLS